MGIVWLAAAVLFLLASGFYSGTEMGLYCVNRIRLRLRAEAAGASDARTLLGLVQCQQETVLAILLGTNLANYLLTASTAALLASAAFVSPGRVEFYTAAILSPVWTTEKDPAPPRLRRTY